MARCDAKIRPFPDTRELQCEGELDTHLNHEATLRNRGLLLFAPSPVDRPAWRRRRE